MSQKPIVLLAPADAAEFQIGRTWVVPAPWTVRLREWFRRVVLRRCRLIVLDVDHERGVITLGREP